MDTVDPALPGRRSDRLAELRDTVQQVSVVHEIGVRNGRPDGTVATAELDGVNVAFVRYGAEVTVDAFPTRDRFALTVPLGPMRVRARGRYDGGVASGAFVLADDEHTVMEPDPQAGALVVSTGAARLEAQLCALTGRPPGRRVRFLPPGSLDTPAPPSLLDQTWRTVCAVLTDCGGDPAPVVRRMLSEQLLTAVLLSQPHTATDTLHRAAPTVPADAVERALAWIDEHYADPVTVIDIARSAGLGPRRLQEEFRRRVGAGPSEVLRQVRLGRAHQALAGGTGEPVADVAHACGFGHLGRFAQAYRERYGESPSATARRHRA